MWQFESYPGQVTVILESSKVSLVKHNVDIMLCWVSLSFCLSGCILFKLLSVSINNFISLSRIIIKLSEANLRGYFCKLTSYSFSSIV